MIRDKLLRIGLVIVLLVFCAVLPAQNVSVEISPVPLWPADGGVSALPDKQYVFLDPVNSGLSPIPPTWMLQN